MRLQNPFLDLYLRYVKDTQSPKIMHVWSAISGISACMGRRIYLDFGIGDIYGNLFIILVGPPGVRKGTAMGFMSHRVREATAVRFAPTDTAGQRQGLISAMLGEENAVQDIVDSIDMNGHSSLDEIVDLDKLRNLQINVDIHPKDSHVMHVAASELSSFIGQRNIQMCSFLNKAFDGEKDPYEYKLKKQTIVLEDYLLSMIGCTTPTDISICLPAEAMGHGFMSRLVFVFANKKSKETFWAEKLSKKLADKIDKTLNTIFYKMQGEVCVSDEAREYMEDVNSQPIKLQDPRFIHYCERRNIILLKVAMCLCVARMSMTIEKQDIEEARLIMEETEKTMPDALGEYGMSPLAAAKQKLLEFIVAAKDPCSANILYTYMSRDMRLSDFTNCLFDLCNSGSIMEIQTADGQAYVGKEDKPQADKLGAIIELAEWQDKEKERM